jgi:hypothetical protein
VADRTTHEKEAETDNTRVPEIESCLEKAIHSGRRGDVIESVRTYAMTAIISKPSLFLNSLCSGKKVVDCV